MVEASELLRRVGPHKFFVERKPTESPDNLLQVIGCALITGGSGAYRGFETPSAESYDSEVNLSLIIVGHVETRRRSDAKQPVHKLTYRARRRRVEEEQIQKPTAQMPMLGVPVDASSIRKSRPTGVLYQCKIEGKMYPEPSGEFIIDSPVLGTYTLAGFGKLTHLMDPWSEIATRSLMKIAKTYAESPERNPTVREEKTGADTHD